EHRLAHLPAERAVRRQEHVLGELLRERAATLSSPARAQVRQQRARDRGRIDAGVAEEAPVLGGEDGGAARGRRRVRASVERSAALAERREHLGLELE